MKKFIFSLLLLFPIGYLANPIDLCKSGSHEDSEKAFEGKYPSPEYYFYRMLNAYALNDKKEGIKWADMLITTFEEVPVRYKDIAILAKTDMETWSDDELENISRDMKKIKYRLKNKMAGPKTQEMQKDVLGRLGKMIKDIEKPEKKKKKEDQEADLNKRYDSWIRPAPDSILPNEQGTGQIDKKRIREIAEVWGKLPEKERAKAMQELMSKMAARDRAAIEVYFRKIK